MNQPLYRQKAHVTYGYWNVLKECTSASSLGPQDYHVKKEHQLSAQA